MALIKARQRSTMQRTAALHGSTSILCLSQSPALTLPAAYATPEDDSERQTDNELSSICTLKRGTTEQQLGKAAYTSGAS